MFSHLSVSMQFIYVCVFSFLAGVLAPFGGGLGFFVISSAVVSGSLVLTGVGGMERLFMHPVWCFFFPFLFTLVLLFLLGYFVLLGFGLSMSATPTSGQLYTYMMGAIGLFCCALPLFLQIRVLNLSGNLQYVAIISAVIGLAIGAGLWVYIARALIGTLFEHEHYFLQAALIGVIVVLVASSIQFFLFKSAASSKRALPVKEQASVSTPINK